MNQSIKSSFSVSDTSTAPYPPCSKRYLYFFNFFFLNVPTWQELFMNRGTDRWKSPPFSIFQFQSKRYPLQIRYWSYFHTLHHRFCELEVYFLSRLFSAPQTFYEMKLQINMEGGKSRNKELKFISSENHLSHKLQSKKSSEDTFLFVRIFSHSKHL